MSLLVRWVLIAAASVLILGTVSRDGPFAAPAPQGPASGIEVVRLIAQLGSGEFSKRESAGKALEEMGEFPLAYLRNAAREHSDIEVRRRCESLVERITARVEAEKLANLSFRAPFFQLDNKPSPNLTASFGEFTLAGPVADKLKPVPDRVTQLAFDPVNNVHYGVTWQGVKQVDLDKGKAHEIRHGRVSLSCTCAAAFDTKRQRLIVATLDGEGRLVEYSPKAGTCTPLAGLDNVDLASLAYDAKNDCFYGIHASRKWGGVAITRYDEKGQSVKEIKLVGDGLPKVVEPLPRTAPVALVAAEGQVILVTLDGLFLVDPASGKVKQTARFR